jgi:hypothetical protein
VTPSIAVRIVDPAILEMMHVYYPTASILNCFSRLPILNIVISLNFSSTIWFLNIQLISIGKSPLVTIHVTEATSPALIGSLPIANCEGANLWSNYY